MPPPPVRALAVFGAGTPARSSFARLSSPPSSTSTSRTTTPLFLPVGTPTLAEGHRFHHRSITCGSVVASQWPLRVSGLLAPGSQGNTGTPRPACARAALSSVGADPCLPSSIPYDSTDSAPLRAPLHAQARRCRANRRRCPDRLRVGERRLRQRRCHSCYA